MSEEAQEVSVESELADIISSIDSAVDEAGIKPDESSNEDIQENSEEVSNEDTETNEDDSDNLEYISEDDEDNSEESSVPEDEQKAREKGWRPKDEFEGEEKDWVDFGEFNRRTELFEKISSQNKVIKSLNKKMDALIKHNQGLVDRTRTKTIAELEAKRREAIEYGDTDAFEEVEKELEEVKKEESVFDENEEETTDSGEVEDKQEIPKDVKNALDDFASKNPWFEKDKEMTDFLVFKTQQIINNEGVSLLEALPQAEKEVKQTFSHKFRNPNKGKPSAVMGGSKENRSSGKKTISSLTSEQKQVWHTLKGVMSEKEFLEQLED